MIFMMRWDCYEIMKLCMYVDINKIIGIFCKKNYVLSKLIVLHCKVDF